MNEALAHVRVVELCDQIPSAYCARQFAVWGASVVTLEPVHGSPLRALPPLVSGTNAVSRSLLWEYLSAGKHTAALDAATLPAHLAGADVFITDWTAERLALQDVDLATLAQRAAALIVVQLSPYGADGPYATVPGSDLTVQALSGYMMLNGLPDAPPLKAPANILAYACGVGAFIGALAALWERGQSGLGQHVELSCLELVTTLVPLLRVQYSGHAGQRQGGPASGTRIFPCKDGYLAFSAVTERGWDNLLLALGIIESDVPEPLRTDVGRRDWDLVRSFIARWTATHEAEPLFGTLNALGMPCGLVRTPHQLLTDPHLAARGFFSAGPHSDRGTVTFPGPPGRLSETPIRVPVPSSEDSSREASDCASLPGAAVSPDSSLATTRGPDTSAREATDSAPPLRGLRLLDLTQAWVGPYATQLLADLGADVIKVESHKRPDVWRGGEGPGIGLPSNLPAHVHPWNANANFNMVNRNKRDLGLDLGSAEGTALFLRLVRNADLVMENYTPRVMGNFGLAYDVLRQEQPDLVMVSFSGYGADGPYRNFKANGATTEATSGWDSLLGYPGGPPLMMGAMQADAITGLQMAALALVALLYRQQGGPGQHVEGSMFEAAVGYIGEQILHASLTGEQASRGGNRDPAMAPHGAFPCQGDDAWIAISVRDQTDWEALLSVVADEPELHDPRFTTLAGRLAAVDDLEAALSRWTATEDRHVLAARLQKAGIPAAPVQRGDEVLHDPHLTARAWFKPMTHADMGTHLHHGHPWRFSRTPPVCATPAPRLGEHSAEVLAGELGLTLDEIARLTEFGISGSVLVRQIVGVETP